MAWNWFDRKRGTTANLDWLSRAGLKLEGKLEATGTFRIDSAMKGTLVSEDTLILGEHAVIEGEIIGNRVVIGGRFEGSIRARGKVEIQPQAIVTGEIHSPCLVIEPGAIFDGQCHMLGPTEAAKPVTIPIRSAGPRRSIAATVAAAIRSTIRRNFFFPARSRNSPGFDKSISCFTSSTRLPSISTPPCFISRSASLREGASSSSTSSTASRFSRAARQHAVRGASSGACRSRNTRSKLFGGLLAPPLRRENPR